MLTLHTVTEDVRESVKWGIIGLIILILLLTVFNLLKAVLFKPKPILPTVSFGLLPPIPFPQSSATQQFTYTLNTVDGTTNIIDPTTNQVQTLPNIINIYKIIHPQPDLTSLQVAKDAVQALGFVSQADPTQVLPEKRLTETEYEWDKTYGLAKSITMDIASNNFHLTSQYLTYPSVLARTNVPTDNSALSTAQTTLSAMNLAPADIDSSLTTTTDYVIVNSVIRKALPAEEIMAVRVNFFQTAVDTYPIFYPNNPDSTMSFLVTGGDTQSEIAQATYVHQTIDMTTYGTYPLKTSDQAYTDLKNGKSYITPSYTGGNFVNIRMVKFGYYLGETDQDYLMPVYEFLGDNNFAAYVSAVSDNMITTTQPSPTGQ